MKLRGLLAALLCAVALPVMAETWYEVELLVVAQRKPDAGSEIWPLKTLPPLSTENMFAVPAPGQAMIAGKIAPLAPENYRLTAEAQRISADASHELLLHTGWRHPGLAREQSIAVRLHAIETHAVTADAAPAAATESERPPRLDGTIRLVLARYLHLEADLRYREADAPHGSSFFSLFSDQTTEKPIYRLNESRRMRSREVHYLDHPMFGIIALVTPYEVPAPAPAPRPAAPAPAASPAPAPATTPGTGGVIRRN